MKMRKYILWHADRGGNHEKLDEGETPQGAPREVAAGIAGIAGLRPVTGNKFHHVWYAPKGGRYLITWR